MSYLGAVDDIGAIGVSPYQIAGNPVMALIAQLNRFAGRTVSPGGKCGTRNYLPHGAIPLSSVLDDHAATIANVMFYDTLNCVSDERLMDFKKMASVNASLGPNVIAWAMANLSEVTTKLAQYGDMLGLSPAAVGITTVDKRLSPKFPVMTVALLGGLAVVAFVVSRRKR